MHRLDLMSLQLIYHINKYIKDIMIKPDGVQRGLIGEIIKRFEQKGYKLLAMKLTAPGKGHMVRVFVEFLLTHIIYTHIILIDISNLYVVCLFRKNIMLIWQVKSSSLVSLNT